MINRKPHCVIHSGHIIISAIQLRPDSPMYIIDIFKQAEGNIDQYDLVKRFVLRIRNPHGLEAALSTLALNYYGYLKQG